MSKKLLIVSVLVLLLGSAGPASAHSAEEPFEYGYFYGTFGEDPNIALLAGGIAEDFCANNPADPFDASPATTTAKTKEHKDGSVTVKVNANHQPIHLYYIGADEDGPPWIGRVCAEIQAGGDAPVPFASGTAMLKVRDRYAFEGGPPIHIFNSVKGKAFGPDGTQYQVQGSADLPFVNGMPVGTPPDWVSFSLK